MLKLLGNSKAIAMLGLASALAGCVTNNMYTSDITPYGGSRMHPIKVVNGKAYVENCGQWPENLADTSSNEMNANQGCAVQSNIAAMVADPSDLTGKHKLPPPLGDVQFTAIKKITGGSSAGSSSSSSSSSTP